MSLSTSCRDGACPRRKTLAWQSCLPTYSTRDNLPKSPAGVRRQKERGRTALAALIREGPAGAASARRAREGPRRLFRRGLWSFGYALEVFGTGVAGRWQPRRLRPGRHQLGRYVTDQDGIWAGSGEGEADARRHLDHAGAELQEPQPDRGELSVGESVCLGDGQ